MNQPEFSEMSLYRPFIYIIGWTDSNFWYLGSRFARNTNPNDLWTRYFTSSKIVTEVREHIGEPDYFEVFVFDSAEEVRDIEARLIKDLELHKSSRWLNKGCFKTSNRSTAERSADMKKHFANPENLERNRTIRKEVNSRPEIREQRRQTSLKLGEDPNHRLKISEGSKRYAETPEGKVRLKDHCSTISRRPEQRQARKEQAKSRWADPEYKKMMSAKIKAGWAKRKLKEE